MNNLLIKPRRVRGAYNKRKTSPEKIAELRDRINNSDYMNKAVEDMADRLAYKMSVGGNNG